MMKRNGLESGSLVGVLALLLGCSGVSDQEGVILADPAAKLLVAHRGASGYAPEHTREAYLLAIEQGADFIEPDLQVTRDGILVALHDLTLERTTNVRDVFPDRFREEEAADGRRVERWYVYDFTLEEISRLDAGSWFDPRFSGARVPTLAEVIELAIAHEVGIFPETKAPEVYGDIGLDMERLLLAELEKHDIHEPGTSARIPVVIQSFSPESLRILRAELGNQLPLTLLLSSPDDGWQTAEGLARVSEFASGIGPAKGLLLADPDIVARAHDLGLTVIPYTFRARNSGDFPDVGAEMSHFLFELEVDGLFTDNPDLFPRQPDTDGG
jgi:glycerophosphoryl diester phosphodiesterase